MQRKDQQGKRPLRILHLEDNPNDSELVRLMLEEKGIASEITRVESNADFSSALERNSYDLIISDFTLPSFDGLSALEIARETSPDTPFLFVSATIGEDAAIESLRSGATDYILKQKMSRFVPAVMRAISEAEVRRERRGAEEALKESERRYREVVENAVEIIFSTDESGNFISANPAALKASGYSLDELRQRNYLDLVLPEFRKKVSRVYQNQFLRREQFSYAEYPFRIRSGEPRWFAQNASLRIYNGKVAGFDLIARDITDLKRAEEALATSESELRALFAAMTDVVLVLDANGRYLQIAPTNPSNLHRPPSELLGKTINEVLPHSDAETIQRNIRLALEKNQPINVEYSLVVGGVETWFDGSVSPFGVDKVVWIARDITSRRKAEEELVLQRSYFEQLFADSPSGITLLDGAEHVLNVNRAFEQMFQYSLAELKGCTLSDYIAPAEFKEEARYITGQSIAGNLIQVETVRKRKDGSRCDVAITSYPITIKGKIVGMYRVFADISERKRLERQLRQAQKLEGIGTLAGGIAHDFNNILGIILAYITVLDKMVGNPAKLADGIEAITKAVQRGASLVRQLLTFARQTDIRLESVSMNLIVQELARMLRATFAKTVEIKLETQRNIPLVTADQTQMHQVLLNLCVNARDAMADGGTITIRTSTVEKESLVSKFPEATDEKYVCVSVSDTGTGMTPEIMGRIFDPFFTTKEAGKGTGLGLAVVYGVTKSHNGFVDVQSEVGKGTTFLVYLPIRGTPASAPGQAKKGIEDAAGGSETILLVEDEESLLVMVRSILEMKGYTVLQAMNGLEAVELFKAQKDRVDLVVTDMGLPKLGGWQAAVQMKQIDRNVRVIFASGFLEPGMKNTMENEGFHNFIQKPYNLNEILQRVRDVLKGAGAP